MKSFLAGMIYTGGIQIIGASLHLKWWTGFGIWLTGVGLMVLFTEGS